MVGRSTRRPREGSTVYFWHESARHVQQWRRGVVVRVVGRELDVIPGLSDPPPHPDFFKLENPPPRSGFDRITYFDLHDVNSPFIDGVEILGTFPLARFRELRRMLAELGVVGPG
jgi:hypothetical protein